MESTMLECGALQKGHFLLSSGRHSDTYVEKFRILERPALTEQLCEVLTEKLKQLRIEFDFVVGPATGGMILAFELARQLGIEARFVETVDGHKLFRRGAKLPIGAKVVVVDDVLTTGLSIQEVFAALEPFGAEVKAIATLIDRSEVPVDFGSPHVSACKVNAKSFAEGELPDSLQSIPITKPGTRA